MTKEEYVRKAFVEIRAKNIQEPFWIATGVKVPDLEKYLQSLEAAYLSNKGVIEKLFYDKIEFLRNYKPD